MLTPGLGFTRQIALSAVCSSMNAPVAPRKAVTAPITVARMFDEGRATPSSMACTASAPWRPTSPSICPTISPRTASRPNTSPATPMAITRMGARANSV